MMAHLLLEDTLQVVVDLVHLQVYQTLVVLVVAELVLKMTELQYQLQEDLQQEVEVVEELEMIQIQLQI